MKNKFYRSLLIGIGFALVTTTSYAKPAHFSTKKHATASVKRAKISSRNAIKITKLSNKHTKLSKKSTKHSLNLTKYSKKKNQFANVSFKQKFSKRKPYHRYSRHPHTILPVTTQRDIHPDIIDPNDQFIEKTDNNTRIHSLIADQHNFNEIKYNDVPIDNQTTGHLTSVHATIAYSLALAGERAGLSDDLMMQLTNIFAWDIDFATNLYPGDQFTVVYENNDSNSGQIVAAEFVNRGKIFTAIRYKDSEGNVNYYSPEGKTMRKAFLSTPVEYTHISSHFDTHRRHPILNRIRAHKGIDYAARTGTPVKSAGDGVVTFIGRKGGYGQVMIVQHGERYETLYAHLSNFKRGLQNGDPVRQGEIIGYVGQTGLATGPHLHYEFRIDGVHRNPETLSLGDSTPLSNHLLADFKSKSQPLLAQLYQTKARTLLAKNQFESN